MEWNNGFKFLQRFNSCLIILFPMVRVMVLKCLITGMPQFLKKTESDEHLLKPLSHNYFT